MGELIIYLCTFLSGLFLGGGIVCLLLRKNGQREQEIQDNQRNEKVQERVLQNTDMLSDILTKKPDESASIWRQAAEENWQDFRKLRHGYINALVSIRQYIRKEKKEELQAYVDSLLAELEAEAGKRRQGNSFLHVFLSHKIRQQEQSGIIFSREILVPSEFSPAEQDIGGILELAFDLAVMMVSRLPQEERRVEIKITYKKQALKLLMQYPCDGYNPQDNQLFSQLERAVEQLRGRVEIFMEKNYFQVKILLYIE